MQDSPFPLGPRSRQMIIKSFNNKLKNVATGSAPVFLLLLYLNFLIPFPPILPSLLPPLPSKSYPIPTSSQVKAVHCQKKRFSKGPQKVFNSIKGFLPHENPCLLSLSKISPKKPFKNPYLSVLLVTEKQPINDSRNASSH